MIINSKLCFTYILLLFISDSLFGDSNFSISEMDIVNFNKSKSNYEDMKKDMGVDIEKLLEEEKELVDAVILNEKKFGDKYVPFYHGERLALLFIQKIITRLQMAKNLTKGDFLFFRVPGDFFPSHSNSADVFLKSYFSKGGNLGDHDMNVRKYLVATNMSILGNSLGYENSLVYFHSDFNILSLKHFIRFLIKTTEQSFPEISKHPLVTSALREFFLKKFDPNYSSFRKGAMLQIFIPIQKVDSLAYPATVGGSLNGTGSIKETYEKIKKGDAKTISEMHSFQHRIVLDDAKFGKYNESIKIFSFTGLSRNDSQEFEEYIDLIVSTLEGMKTEKDIDAYFLKKLLNINPSEQYAFSIKMKRVLKRVGYLLDDWKNAFNDDALGSLKLSKEFLDKFKQERTQFTRSFDDVVQELKDALVQEENPVGMLTVRHAVTPLLDSLKDTQSLALKLNSKLTSELETRNSDKEKLQFEESFQKFSYSEKLLEEYVDSFNHDLNVLCERLNDEYPSEARMVKFPKEHCMSSEEEVAL